MKLNGVWIRILLSLVTALLLFLNISDLMVVLNHPGEYPFGSEFFSPNSIYRSRNFYVWFVCSSGLFLVITLLLIWKQQWRWLVFVLIIDMAFFLYPFFTADN